MDNSLLPIFRFLEQFEPEVSGRSQGGLDPALRAQLLALAHGELPASEQESLIEQLQQDPLLQRFLADVVKSLRVGQKPTSRPPSLDDGTDG